LLDEWDNFGKYDRSREQVCQLWNTAQVMGQLDRMGTIAPGKLADLVLVDRDVPTATPEQSRDTKVVWTMYEGKTVFGNGP